MDCSRFGQLVHDLDRPGALGEPERVEALGHTGACAPCAGLLDQVRTLNASFRDLAREAHTFEASSRVETALRTIYRQRRALEIHARSWRRWAWAGAAAIIVVAVVTALTLRRDTGPVTPIVAHAPAQKNPPAIQPATANHPQEQVQAIDNQQLKPAQNPESESAGDFVPLPDSFPLLAAEEASVVRVQLHRGALSAFGLLVNEERAADLIQVEFLIAEDGTPRAVRYVR